MNLRTLNFAIFIGESFKRFLNDDRRYDDKKIGEGKRNRERTKPKQKNGLIVARHVAR